MSEPSDIARQFARDQYALVPGLAPAAMVEKARRYLANALAQGRMGKGDTLVPGTPFLYGDQMLDWLLETLRPSVERLTGLQLYPTYSYARVYGHGASMRAHRDRPACEISVSLNLGQEPDAPWALHIGNDGDDFPALLTPGDALLYRGMAMTHWREPYAGEKLFQAFLHYVDRNGPHTEERFDRRGTLGPPVR